MSGPSAAVEALFDRYDVAAETRAFLAADQAMWIDGRACTPRSGARIEVIEPSTGGRLTDIPAGGSEDVDAAVVAARQALRGPWAEMKPNARQAVLLRLAELMERDAQVLAEIETLDNGKALGPCLEMDIGGSIELIRYMAGFAHRIEGAVRPLSAAGEHLGLTFKEPVGVVAAIVPWNWPLNMATWKLAAPLAREAGLPPGVLNVVTGAGEAAGAALAAHPDVDKVSFTGSTAVGRGVGAAAGAALSSTTLELGGKSPMLVFGDADPAAVAEAARWSIFFNAGQVCSGGSRLYVQRAIFDQVVEAVAETARAIRLDCGLDPACDMGPVVSPERQAAILSHVERGLAEGARLVTGGGAPERPGCFVEPTLLTVDRNEAALMREEIFGPVLTAMPFEDEAEALRLANDNAYGLGASVWTQDISRAMRLTRRLEAGTVWVNAHDLVDSAIPFGGFKASGHGKDLGPEQVEACLRTKAVWLKL